jgi:hypothetical protein|tara:strand:- start:7 stop:183 length:177 start_codon:yes stop_codon:yes gene_type:complete
MSKHRGEKPENEASGHISRKHVLICGTEQEKDDVLAALENMDDVRAALRVILGVIRDR